ncbi:MAG TPA: tRNA (adenosine(37)-N6)-threonylcarbamoyltransferase complex dimerization subunit type 1 TsaB [Candidatus Gracilibacteria bacterium]|nr:tRNA (adenosine(37)-N6)-threonylcarbamoyltransferase complex dimerization subunit type 1 TsaB [Candidatus Gracilibacteria bacterium]
MVTLAINTASRTTQIALLKQDKILKEKEWISENNESEKLMPEIDDLLKNKKIKYDDLERIIVVKGPGSFTGLRVGVSVANAIAYVQKIPVYGIDSFKFLRAKNEDDEIEVIVLFASRSEVYVQLTEKSEPVIYKVEEAVDVLKEKGIKKVFGEVLQEQKKSFKEVKLIESTKTFGETVLSLKEKELEKKSIIEPLYIKGPGISNPKPIK